MANSVEYFDLTHPEKRVFYLQNYHQGTTMWVIPMAAFFKKPVDEGLLDKAINLYLRNNRNARLRLAMVDGEAKQYFAPYSEERIERFDFSESGGNERYAGWAGKVSCAPFEPFLDAPLYYFAIVKLEGGRTGFFMKMHHAAFDGVAMAFTINKVTDYYFRLEKGEADVVEEFAGYERFVESEKKYLGSADFAADRGHWNSAFAAEMEQLELKPGALNEDCAIARKAFRLSDETARLVYGYCDKKGVSAFRVFMAAMYAYLFRLTMKEDVTIETAHHNRAPEFMGMSGMFVSTLPHRMRVSPEATFGELLDGFSATFAETMKHQRYPVDMLVRELHEKGRGAESMFAVSVVQYLENVYSTEVETEFYANAHSMNLLTFYFNYDNKKRNKLEYYLDYKTSVYDEKEIELMAGHIENLIAGAMREPGAKINSLKLLSAAEERRIAHELNDTAAYYPEDRTVVDLFDEQVKKHPQRAAVVCGERALTYLELGRKAGSLARRLRAIGVKRGDIVGIYVDRTPEMIVGVLGIMKAGAAYMPIEPRYPDERIEFMLADSGSKVLLTQKSVMGDLKFEGTTVDLDDPASFEGPGEIENISRPEDLAYVIYTSGSTGKPKGTLLRHDSLTNLSCWYKNSHEMTENDNLAKHSSFGFDVSVIETFPPLICGACIHLISEDIKLSVVELNEYFEKNNITLAFIITQLAEQFMETVDNRSLRWLDTGGEKLRVFRKRNFRLLNCYGPTECTVYTTAFEVDRYYDNIPIGRPLSNIRLYVVDRFGNLLPEGYAGELCVAGVCVAKGYLNRPETEAQKFVECPFEPGAKMYRTGDLVRRLRSGDLEYLGRMDNQVKLRGFRIELGEIEQQLLKAPGVKDSAVVLANDRNGSAFLCGYVVVDGGFDADAIKKAVARELPEYMIPAHIVRIDKMPLSPNGKTDRRALPEPLVEAGLSSEYVEPAEGAEKKLAELWRRIIGCERVGACDNFFRIGGHSLKAIVMQSAIEKDFGVRLSIKTIFEKPTVRELAAMMARPAEAPAGKADKAPAKASGYFPASSVQKRLFAIDRMSGPTRAYNVPFALRLDGKVEKLRLSEAIQKVIDRHDALRVSFAVVDGAPVQKVEENLKLIKLYQEVEENGVAAVIDEICKPFDLSAAPLFRIRLLRVGGKYHLLLLNFHHIIFDGMSLEIFVRELFDIYEGRELPELKHQYADFVSWQEGFLGSAALKSQEKAWLEMMAGEIAPLDLPTDRQRPASGDDAGGRFEFSVDAEFTSSLKSLADRTGATLYLLLMSAFNVLLSKYTSQQDIIVGSPLMGRPTDEAQKMIGMFVNTMPIRNFPKPELPFADFLGQVRSNFLTVIDNQDYQFDALVEKLNIKREPGKNPLFDTVFVFQGGEGIKERTIGDIRITPRQIQTGAAKFDILMESYESNGSLKFGVEYRSAIFEHETIKRMCGHFINILSEVAADPSVRIRNIHVISATEMRRLLVELNNTAANYPRDLTIHQCFEKMAAKYPDNAAVEFGGRAMTYRELNSRANRLARRLREKGVTKDSPVAIVVERSAAMITGLIAIMKAGGAYLPINPEYPADRIRYTVEDSGSKVVLTTADRFATFDGLGASLVDISDEGIYAGGEAGNLENVNGPSDMAYIIYTSGSTGKPKGVVIEHRNVVRLMINDRFQYKFSEKDVWTMFHSYTFDFSVWEMYGALLYGGKLIVVSKDDAQSPRNFMKLIEAGKVTVLNQTPGAFYNLIDEDAKADGRPLASLRYVTFGGEALKPVMLREFHLKYPATKLINMYGITETTVHVTFKEITRREIELNISNIGTPIPTLKTYVMDANLRLMPTGAPGELCVGGDGVARGYLNRPELTAARFVENPYNPRERLYRSGDLVKMLSCGEMEYLGRIDFQVKIRGFRVELGEIENQLLKHEDILKVIVLAREDEQKNKYLCAYFTSKREITVKQLREFLQKTLTDYMVPSYFIRLEQMPLNANGKVDRKALPDPSGMSVSTGAEHVEPATPKEKAVAKIWMEVLNVGRVGMNDNFFALGGHSLKAVALTAKLQHGFEVAVNDVFKYQTLSELCKNITEKKDNLRLRLDEVKASVARRRENAKAARNSPRHRAALAEYSDKNRAFESLDLAAAKDYRSILLTGVTGYLGVHLLKGLLARKDCAIHLPVRGKDAAECIERVNANYRYYFGSDIGPEFMGRLNIFPADLGTERLGVGNELYGRLLEEVDCVVNSAAIVKHYGRREEFYAANVESVKNLVEFASKGRAKDIHHISTLSVALGKIGEGAPDLFTEDMCDIGQVSRNLYVSTKLEAEKLLVAARAGRGVKSSIYRIGNISFNSATGSLQRNAGENAFSVLVRAFVNLGMVPDAEDEAEFSFVDAVSDSILRLFDRAALENWTFHLQNSEVVKLSRVLRSATLGLAVDELKFGDFIDALYGLHGIEAYRPYVDDILLHKGWLSEDEHEARSSVPADRTNLVLAMLGFEWPKLVPEKMLSFMEMALSERTAKLAAGESFAGASPVALRAMSFMAKDRVYAEGSPLTWEGEKGGKLYYIVEGNAELMKNSKSGWTGTIGVAGPGGVVGCGSIFGLPYNAISEAVMGDVRVLEFDAARLKKLMLEDPGLCFEFFRRTNERSERLETVIVSMG